MPQTVIAAASAAIHELKQVRIARGRRSRLPSAHNLVALRSVQATARRVQQGRAAAAWPQVLKQAKLLRAACRFIKPPQSATRAGLLQCTMSGATRVAASCCAGLTRRRRRRTSRLPQVGSAAAAVAAYNSSWGYADLGMGPGRVRYTRDYSATLVGVAGAGDSRRPPSASPGCPAAVPRLRSHVQAFSTPLADLCRWAPRTSRSAWWSWQPARRPSPPRRWVGCGSGSGRQPGRPLGGPGAAWPRLRLLSSASNPPAPCCSLLFVQHAIALYTDDMAYAEVGRAEHAKVSTTGRIAWRHWQAQPGLGSAPNATRHAVPVPHCNTAAAWFSLSLLSSTVQEDQCKDTAPLPSQAHSCCRHPRLSTQSSLLATGGPVRRLWVGPRGDGCAPGGAGGQAGGCCIFCRLGPLRVAALLFAPLLFELLLFELNPPPPVLLSHCGWWVCGGAIVQRSCVGLPGATAALQEAALAAAQYADSLAPAEPGLPEKKVSLV